MLFYASRRFSMPLLSLDRQNSRAPALRRQASSQHFRQIFSFSASQAAALFFAISSPFLPLPAIDIYFAFIIYFLRRRFRSPYRQRRRRAC